MRAVIQRVSHASVTIGGVVNGEIEHGFLVLAGICGTDTEEIVRRMAEKISRLRVFEDENGKMNLSLSQVGGAVLSISQFTLYADCRKGNRPGFDKAAKPPFAEQMYLYFNESLRGLGIHVEEGIFGADMKVSLLNDGPVTICLDSDEVIR